MKTLEAIACNSQSVSHSHRGSCPLCTSSGRTWRSRSISCRRSVWAGPTELGAPQPPAPPPPCTPATWNPAQDQVWRERQHFAVRCLHNEDIRALSTLNIMCIPLIPDGQHFYPSSPRKNYTSTPRRGRRSHSASVRFKDSNVMEEDVRYAISLYKLFQSQ